MAIRRRLGRILDERDYRWSLTELLRDWGPKRSSHLHSPHLRPSHRRVMQQSATAWRKRQKVHIVIRSGVYAARALRGCDRR